MSIGDTIQTDYLNTSVQPTVVYSTRNYATLGLSVIGTLSGVLVVEGSNDGVSWEMLPIAEGGAQVPNNYIADEGTYIVGVAGYAQTRLVPTGFSGSIQVTANISTRITPAFTVGTGG